MPRTYTHWIAFDSALPERDREKYRRAFSRGSRFTFARIYRHPTNNCLSVAEVHSPDAYADLDLEVNSLTSPLRRLARKPAGLGPGLAVRTWESIYGPLLAGGTP